MPTEPISVNTIVLVGMIVGPPITAFAGVKWGLNGLKEGQRRLEKRLDEYVEIAQRNRERLIRLETLVKSR